MRVEGTWLLRCCENELVVCSFNTDGLRVQTAALAMLFEDNPAITSVAHIHCFAHLANLVFVHLFTGLI